MIWKAHEWPDAKPSTTDLAEQLGVTTPTVSANLKKLARDGYIDYKPYGAITLTPTGTKVAVRIVRRHRILETYLVRKLDLRWDQVHEEAHRLEHAVSDLVLEHMDAALGYPSHDPHGDPIPTAAGQVAPDPSLALVDAAAGQAATVVRVSDRDPEALRSLSRHGITVGTRLQVTDVHAEHGTVTVEPPAGGRVILDQLTASALRVRADENAQSAEQLAPDHAKPWALQVAIHRDRADPANHIDVCEAVGRAVVTLLADERSASGDWADAVAYWRAGWIRKVVRRADGKRWDDVQEVPGVTVARGRDSAGADVGIEVRAFVPGPLTPLPKAVKKLQVGGTEFPHLHDSENTDAVVTVHINPHLTMTTGKAAAQVGHAAQLAYESMTQTQRAAWRATGFTVRAIVPSADEWDAATGGQPDDSPENNTGEAAAPSAERVSVVDAGLTELDGPTETTRAYW